MRSIRKLGIIVLLAVTGACGNDPVNIAQEEEAVRASWQELRDTFTSKDWQRYAELWVHEPYLQVVHPGNRDWITGWDAFERRLTALASSEVRWDFETTRLEVHVSPDGKTAWAIGEVVLRMDGQPRTSWQMAVFQKIGGDWRVAAAFATPLPALPAANE